MSRLSVPLKGRASGPSGHFAQPRLIGYSGPPTGRPALHHRESACSSSFSSFSSSSTFFFTIVVVVFFLPTLFLLSVRPSASLAQVFRFVEPLRFVPPDRRRFYAFAGEAKS